MTKAASLGLTVDHFRELHVGSGIGIDVIRERGYRSLDLLDHEFLVGRGYSGYQLRTPGLFIPCHAPGEAVSTHSQFKANQPRVGRDGKPVKYDNPDSAPKRLDVPARFQDAIGDPSRRLFLAEGVKKTDVLATHNLVAVGVDSIYGWRGQNSFGGKTLLADFERIAFNDRQVVLAFDEDVWRPNRYDLRKSVDRITAVLVGFGATVLWCVLPKIDGLKKTGVDDFIVHRGIEALEACISEPDARPRIDVNDRLDRQVEDCWQALSHPAPRVFLMGDRLVEPPPESQPDRLRGVREHGLRVLLSETIDFIANRQNGTAEVHPPLPLAKAMIERTAGVTKMTRLVHTPVFLSDGRLLQEPGFDPASGVYLSPMVDVPPIPEQPTQDNVREALDLIGTMIADFPFSSPADRANAIALGLEPFARSMIAGPMPLHLIESPRPGTGKGKLAKVLLRGALGQWPEERAAPESDAEFRKQLTAAQESGAGVFFIDNVEERLDFASLANALTSGRRVDRRLGQSEEVGGEILWSWVATGNNPEVSADIGRRCVRTRLVALVENPEDRRFTIPCLEEWAAERQGELAHAFLTLIQAWVVAGRPTWEEVEFGSFEKWRDVIGGILAHAGVPDFLGNLDEFREAANPDVSLWRHFVGMWWDTKGTGLVTAKDLLPIVEAGDLEFDLGAKDHARSLGNKVGKRVEEVFGDLQIRRDKRSRKFFLRSISGAEPPHVVSTETTVTTEDSSRDRVPSREMPHAERAPDDTNVAVDTTSPAPNGRRPVTTEFERMTGIAAR